MYKMINNNLDRLENIMFKDFDLKDDRKQTMSFRIIDENTEELLNTYNDETTLGELITWLDNENLTISEFDLRDDYINIRVYRW